MYLQTFLTHSVCIFFLKIGCRVHLKICFKVSCEAGNVWISTAACLNSIETVIRGSHIIEEEITKPLKQNNIIR